MTAAVVVATVALLVQGTRCMVRSGAPPFVRHFGALTLLLAALSFALFAILFWGEAVLSPEFGVVMTRGHWRGLVILVVGFAVAAGLGLQIQRLKAALPGRLGGLLFLGLAVGASAALRITPLNDENAPPAFMIYSYDLWWPPLLLWLSACFLEGALTILGVRNRRVRAAAFLAMLLGLSLGARSRGVFADPTAATLWTFYVVVALLGWLLWVLWLVWRWRQGLTGPLARLGASARHISRTLGRGLQQTVSGRGPSLAALAWRQIRPMAGRLLLLLALMTIAASLVDIFYLGWVPDAVALVVVAVAWTCLAEVTAQGPLRAFVVSVVPEIYEELASQESWLRQVWLLLRGRLAGPLGRLGGMLRRLVTLRPFPEAVVKVGVLLVVLLVAYEVPHAGKTLLQPFTAVTVKGTPGDVPTVSPQAEIGQAVFNHLLNTLGTLTIELQPDVILLLPPGTAPVARFRTLAPGGPGSIDPFLAQETDIEVGGVKIRLGLFLTPLLRPVRWLFGVRVIEGSVLADPDGYTVLTRSSTGEVWRTRLRTEDWREASSAGLAGARSTPDSAFSQLALELAFRIMSAEPALATFGMTRSWDAFQYFKTGLDRWQEFSQQSGEGDPDALSGAIGYFRAAIGVDPGFALAHYRLGLALQRDGETLGAAEAFRASLKANPGFVPAMVALASVLYGSEHSAGVRLISLATSPVRKDPREAQVLEARHLWQSVIGREPGASPLDRAAAWAGLCRDALDEPTRADRQQSDEAASRSYRTAFFHCQQAERLYGALFDARREDLRVRTARASELASIGVLLERHGPDNREPPDERWHCSAGTIDKASLTLDPWSARHVVLKGHFTRAALKYYRRAVALLPDDPVLRCHEAAAVLARSGDWGPMEALENEATAHWLLAEAYRDEALTQLGGTTAPSGVQRESAGKLAAAYFALALREYEETLKHDPTNFEALNRYARVFWEWRHAEAECLERARKGQARARPTVSPPECALGPGLEQARQAEAFARRAVSMVEAKEVTSIIQAPGAGHGDQARAADDGTPSRPAAPMSRAAGLTRSEDDSMPRHLRPAAATARASLGAVLVAEGRAYEAIEELESANRVAPEHPSFDDGRWMLAQAHLCAASEDFRKDFPRGSRDPQRTREKDPRLEPITKHREEARRSLDVILAHERIRETQPFKGLTHVSRRQQLCPGEEDWLSVVTRRKGPLSYTLSQGYSTNYRSLCGWLGVRIEADTVPEPGSLYLHVWGGRADERVPVDEMQERRDAPFAPAEHDRHPAPTSGGRFYGTPIPLVEHDRRPMAAFARRFYYFAQLEDAKREPKSLPLSLEPPTGEEGSGTPPAASGPTDDRGSHVPAVSLSEASAPQVESAQRCPLIKNLIVVTLAPTDPPSADQHTATKSRASAEPTVTGSSR